MENKEIKEYIKNIEKIYPEEYSEFVQKNSLLFYNIACVEIGKIQRIQQHIKNKNNYDLMELSNSFEMSQQFFNMHNIKINLKELFDNKILVFYDDDGRRNNQFFSDNFGPASYQGYTKQRGKYIEIFLSNSIMDAFAIAHEVTHYMNQPEGQRSVVSDMLTESLSYGMEFVFAQLLLNENFMIEDAKYFIYNCHIELLKYAYKMAPIYRILHVYKKCKKINIRKYNKIIENGNYENDIAIFIEYINANRDYIHDTWDFLGRSMAVYIYNEYRKDKEIIRKMIKLNDAINYMVFEYCLQIIGIQNMDDLFYKISDALESNIDYIMNWG